MCNGTHLDSSDNTATRVLPSTLLTRGTFDLSEAPGFDGPRLPYTAVRVGRRVLNVFPSGTAIVALPHAALALLGSGGRVTTELVLRWDKHAAALISLAAAGLVWAAARRWGDAEALGAAAVFALASPVVANAAQSLWSATGEVFCLALALFLLLRARPSARLAGLAVGAAFACRPTSLLVAAAIGAALFATDRRLLPRWTTAALLSIAGVAAVQFAAYGHPLGAYGAMNTARRAFGSDTLGGLAGVLVSPARGLLVYCPWVLLLLAGAAAARRGRDGLFAWSLASIAATLAVAAVAASHVFWWGGSSLGPRLLTDVVPLLALATVPLFRARGALRAAFLACLAFAAVTQFLLSYEPRAREWDHDVLGRLGTRALWRVRDGPLAVAWGAPLRVGAPPPEETPGSAALTGSVDDPAEGAAVEGRLRVRGWARSVESDLGVTFYIDRENRTPASFRRTARPDVCAAIPALVPCDQAGYEATFEPRSGDGGRHELLVVFRAPDGRIRHYSVRPFVWTRGSRN